ncbi:MAG: alpha/beta hydrolase-fold protein [Verrucomicrobiales bacterium]|nr:alpha/beta hydrolase-fold protein [Verrucomicrobiales bacterium]
MKFLNFILFVAVQFSLLSAADREPSIVWINEMPADAVMPPHTTHQTFYSKAAGREVGYCLYLPPGYEEGGAVRYPVIYNLHGNGGNEFHSFEDVEVLHAGILAGKWPPMMVALPNGGHSTFYKDSHDGKLPIETIFIEEFIPHIDSTYRTIAAREGRCLEGFSMGGRGSLRLAMKYPDLFCSLFCQAGNIPRTLKRFEAADHWEDVIQGYLGPDRVNYVNNDAFLLLEKNLKKIKGRLRIQMACGTKDGGHLPTVRDFHEHLMKNKVDHTYIELEGLAHRRTEMIKRLEPVWFDYHVESIRLATEAAGK